MHANDANDATDDAASGADAATDASDDAAFNDAGINDATGTGDADRPGPADRRWAVAAHLSAFLLPFAGPLFVEVTRGWHRPWVRAHAIEALNFQITFALSVVGSFVVIVLTVGLGLLWYAVIPVFVVHAATRAARGREHRYPVNVRWFRPRSR